MNCNIPRQGCLAAKYSGISIMTLYLHRTVAAETVRCFHFRKDEPAAGQKHGAVRQGVQDHREADCQAPYENLQVCSA